ncbi:TPA: hypothetical protein HA259_03065, partial [Thermoplasmata archaeon]|nr:hypothetical protein [Thermoplasmata archaeon]
VATQITGEMSLATKMHLMTIAFVLLLWVATDLIDRAVLWFVRALRTVQRTVLRLFGRRVPEVEEGPTKTPDELLREISEKHPEWRLGLLRHVMAERQRHGDFVRRKVSRAAPENPAPPSETVD